MSFEGIPSPQPPASKSGTHDSNWLILRPFCFLFLMKILENAEMKENINDVEHIKRNCFSPEREIKTQARHSRSALRGDLLLRGKLDGR